MQIFLRLVFLLLLVSSKDLCSLQQINDPKKIVIFGAGYVGTVSGACLAKCGHKITFIDPETSKIALLNNKKSPVLEPQLEELVRWGVENGLIEAKCALGKEILEADIAMIAVPTPSNEDGSAHLEYLENVFGELRSASMKRTTPLIVSIRSTLLPTDFRRLQKRYFSGNPLIAVVVNPEFLRESTAVEDFFHPPFCVAGGDDPVAVKTVLSLYQEICPKRFAVSAETACLLKYSCNAFHAAKIAFANELTSLCDSLEMDPVELMTLFSEDTLLNCSSAYLKPGFAFGGSCLKKDLRALLFLGANQGISSPLLSAILPSNDERFQAVAEHILKQNHSCLAILGMSFKRNSGDLRESPFLQLIELLHQNGIRLDIFDPDIQANELPNHFSHLLPLITADLASVLATCDGVVLCKDLLNQTEIQRLNTSQVPIYDLGYFLPKRGTIK